MLLQPYGWVATVLTACGIETFHACSLFFSSFVRLQQCLPLAVLKHFILLQPLALLPKVATVLTACGIETVLTLRVRSLAELVATVLTACGIETFATFSKLFFHISRVATVLTACGIETSYV